MADVVIAEDVKLQRLLLQKLIEKEHTIVGVAGDGDEAIELVKKHDPDLVIMDLTMPNEDGLMATRWLKFTNPELPILIVTAKANKAIQDQLHGYGVEKYLIKPVSKRTLLEMIEHVID